jgi:tetratricopeptide (TPR) repeat protein
MKIAELLTNAQSLLDELKYAEVIALLPDKVLDKYNNAELYICRAWAHNQLNEHEIALKYTNKALIAGPDILNILNQKGIDWYNQGEYDRAIAEYDKALMIDGNFTTAYYNKGLVFYAKGDYDYAIAEYDKVIEIDENDTITYNNRGLAWQKKGDLDKAISDYSKAIDCDPNYYLAYYNRGLTWYYKGEYEKAIDDNDKVILLQPNYADAYLNRGLAWNYKGDYNKAIADYDKVIILKPGYINAFINRGIAYYYIGDYDKAIEDYSAAIKLGGNFDNVFYNRGLAYFNRGTNRKDFEDFKNAVEDFNKALELRPSYIDALLYRGMAWYELKEYDNAIEDCTNTLKINPTYADAYNTRGNSWLNKGDFEKAEEDFRNVVGFIGYEAIGNANLGDLFSSKGEFDKAGEFYDKIKIVPEKLAEQIFQKKERNVQRISLVRANVPISNLMYQIEIENKIEQTIEKIRKAAKSNAKNVVHYTKIFVADIYVSSLNSKMHYSNAIYMNDPMEGKVFFDFLDDANITQAYLEGEKRNEISVYLGSFLPAENSETSKSHDDELVMWRTYGKDENGNEAGGCSLVLSCDFFMHKKKQPQTELNKSEIENVNSNLAVIKEEYSKHKINDEELLNVIYLDIHDKQKNIRNDPQKRIKEALDELKSQLKKMIKLKNARNTKREFKEYIENTIFKQLSTISYLFKSADYIYENEARVIKYVSRDSNAIKFREVKEPNTPRKRFYIESNNEILPYIRKIYLGPKVENHQQWSLYLDFEIRQRAKEILKMDAPPFKIDPSVIQILKSECKFQ